MFNRLSFKLFIWTFIVSLLMSVTLIKAAPMIWFGRLSTREMLTTTWAIGKLNNRFYSLAVTPLMLGLSASDTDDNIKWRLLTYGWGKCSIDDYTLGYVDAWNSLRNLLKQSRFFLVCPRDTSDNAGLVWLWTSTDPFRLYWELATATTVQADSCKYYSQRYASWAFLLSDWVYRVDADWAWTWSAVNVYCDMTTDGGWWMLLATNSTASSQVSNGRWGLYSGCPNNIFAENKSCLWDQTKFDEFLYSYKDWRKIIIDLTNNTYKTTNDRIRYLVSNATYRIWWDNNYPVYIRRANLWLLKWNNVCNGRISRQWHRQSISDTDFNNCTNWWDNSNKQWRWHYHVNSTPTIYWWYWVNGSREQIDVPAGWLVR